LTKVEGPEAGLKALESIETSKLLTNYYLLYALRADIEVQLDRPAQAAEHYARAMTLTESEPERAFLRKKLESLP
jgi:RNA polymerase sigma-70 factor (ECF subfamily)